MKNSKYDFNRVAPYVTGSQYVTVYTGRRQRSLYRFNPDLTEGERATVLNNLRYGEHVDAFLSCGDLLQVKAKA